MIARVSRPLGGLEPRTLGVLALALGVAALIGVLAAATAPLLVAGALVAGITLGAIWRRPTAGLFLFVVVIASVPFGVIPVPLAGAQLTFVDAVLLATYSAVLVRMLFATPRLEVHPGRPGAALIAFALVACLAFVAGGAAGSIAPEQIRRFGKLLASLALFFVASALIRDHNADGSGRLLRWLLIAGAVQGAVGTALMALSPTTQLDLLTRLGAIGYPTTDVLRYVPGPNDTYTDQLRAIGTSVDPNVFGGTVMLALALAAVQWASPQPLVRRWVLVLLAAPMLAGVVLSLSRASWLGLACGLALIGGLRYRRILVLGSLAAVALLLTPVGRDVVVRFVSGFSTADRATAFRVGEYANALTLIQRYPLLGIGFGNSPDIDVTAGVSSVYLLVAEQTGLLGLAFYALALGLTWWLGVRAFRATNTDARLQGVRAAFLAAITAALVAGLLDHYFANQAFPSAVGLFWLYAAGLTSASRTPPEISGGGRLAARQ